MAPDEVKQAQAAPTQEKATAQAKPPVEQTKAKAEKQTNCLGCNKTIVKLQRYYRDGKFYCSKTCWRKYITKSKEEKK